MTFCTALTLVTVPVIVAASAMPARAQAWLPPQGEGAVSFVPLSFIDSLPAFQDLLLHPDRFAVLRAFRIKCLACRIKCLLSECLTNDFH